MAVDTREKRASALGVAGPWLVQLPLADGTIAALDRTQGTWAYSGITISAPATGVKESTWVSTLGIHGYMRTPVAEGVYVKIPESRENLCTYKTLICTGAVTLSTAIDDSQNSYSTPITDPTTFKTLICTRNVTVSTDIDDSVITIDTTIGCT